MSNCSRGTIKLGLPTVPQNKILLNSWDENTNKKWMNECDISNSPERMQSCHVRPRKSTVGGIGGLRGGKWFWFPPVTADITLPPPHHSALSYLRLSVVVTALCVRQISSSWSQLLVTRPREPRAVFLQRSVFLKRKCQVFYSNMTSGGYCTILWLINVYKNVKRCWINFLF